AFGDLQPQRRARHERERARQYPERALAVALAERGQVVRRLVLEFAPCVAVHNAEEERDVFGRLDPLDHAAILGRAEEKLAGDRLIEEGGLGGGGDARRGKRRAAPDPLDQRGGGQVPGGAAAGGAKGGGPGGGRRRGRGFFEGSRALLFKAVAEGGGDEHAVA